ncbi:hypothetical protein K7887_03190 [Sutcliffiella horikoshii]|uniref:hypothetical protein n=1 Tax=Sutcliffiella horikoshii TaxID=79883 RepID=UPI001CBEC9C4|nr:hypothetical protein [Sutcliffiella horikoshii]UAL47986.1 hypothetical protein K7887_03190 [Sutcliffiella horikoshii]
MIYKKDANFPYPVLTNKSNSYASSQFILDVELHENVHHYQFNYKYEIDSAFINKLLREGRAQLILIIQSKDNKFFKVSMAQSSIKILKSRISISSRTSIQMHIQSTEDVSFRNNEDLSTFYDKFKDELVVPKHSILGFSNVVMFEGSTTKPLELFEKKLNPALKSAIKIELSHETIVIQYRNEEFQFNNLPKSNTLNNPYVYTGMHMALHRFIVNNGEDNEYVDLLEIDPPANPLDLKLYHLMRKKMVEELGIDTIDEVIYAISDRMIEKYTTVVKGLISSGS